MKWIVALCERRTGKQVGEFARIHNFEVGQPVLVDAILLQAIRSGSIAEAFRFEELAMARKVAAYLPAWDRNEWRAISEPMDLAMFEDGARAFAAKHSAREDLTREQLARASFFAGASAGLSVLGTALAELGPAPPGVPVDCRMAEPGRAICVECAEGRYENCLWCRSPAIKPGVDDAHAG